MRKLALRDEILLQIDKAARYIGGEVNAVMKNKEDVDIRFAMAFPDVYEIGMSNLGMMILYDMILIKLCAKKTFHYLHWNLRIR